jgi:hypothetical protein
MLLGLHQATSHKLRLFFLQAKLKIFYIIKTSAIFLKKIGSGMHSDPKFGQRRGMCYIDATVKGFWDAIPAYVLLSKNFQNAV